MVKEEKGGVHRGWGSVVWKKWFLHVGCLCIWISMCSMQVIGEEIKEEIKVTIHNGDLVGERSNGFFVFRGIPYAGNCSKNRLGDNANQIMQSLLLMRYDGRHLWQRALGNQAFSTPLRFLVDVPKSERIRHWKMESINARIVCI